MRLSIRSGRGPPHPILLILEGDSLTLLSLIKRSRITPCINSFPILLTTPYHIVYLYTYFSVITIKILSGSQATAKNTNKAHSIRVVHSITPTCTNDTHKYPSNIIYTYDTHKCPSNIVYIKHNHIVYTYDTHQCPSNIVYTKVLESQL